MYLERCTLCRHGREANNIAEVDGDAVEGFSLHRLPPFELLGY